jgi:flagellar L-ring protein precursor FlgH
MLNSRHQRFLVLLATSVLSAVPLLAKNKPSPVAVSLEQYIRQAKEGQPALQTKEGSLYTEAGYNSDLYGDVKARHVNDIVTIRVIERTVAQSSADSETNRKSSTALAANNVFGVENHNPNFPFSNVVTAASNMSFKGDGATTRSGTVSAYISARVRDVLPNGDLVIEGIKEIKVNNERQILSILGVARSKDVGPDNVVLSTSIANMLVQIDGKGIVSDNLNPGWLYKILTKIWPF